MNGPWTSTDSVMYRSVQVTALPLATSATSSSTPLAAPAANSNRANVNRTNGTLGSIMAKQRKRFESGGVPRHSLCLSLLDIQCLLFF